MARMGLTAAVLQELTAAAHDDAGSTDAFTDTESEGSADTETDTDSDFEGE